MSAALPTFIKPIEEVSRDAGLYILVYGNAGAGKTTLCATTPDPEKTLVLSAERGTLSIKDSGVKCAEVKTLADIRRIFKYLEKGEHPFEWVCLDSVSEIAEVVLEEELTKNRDGRKAYGEMATTMVALLKTFRDLRLNVVVLAAAREKDDEGRIVLAPDTPGNKLAEKLPYLFDEVFFLHVGRGEDGEIKRALLTSNDGKRVTKDRSGKLAQWEPANLTTLHTKIMETAQ